MTRKKPLEAEMTLIDELVVVLATLAAQMSAAVAEINDANVGAVVSIRHIARLITYISNSVAVAKASNDTPPERARIVSSLLSTLRQLESDERMQLDTRRAVSAQHELSITTATIAQVLAVVGDEEVAA
ncbi:hypothetical protein [Bifidobacterium choerinum]|uniref:Uncharacterized protein n=1 Tax=Bifidobacterium choerinum TaxID=35760 RepID=A0A087AH82_9BIFI|nr:hypothetical protein [Bifidobacterium choerinum]KFI58132.1 hypothetical protein BCHO_0215 [Bifidobacterium choerinum]